MTGLLEVKEVAVMLGVSARAVYRLKDARKLPYVQWGRQVRFEAEKVMQFIEQHRVEAIDFEAEADTMCV